MQQHERLGKNTSNYTIVFVSKNPIEAHLIETQYHMKGYAGFGPNVGQYTMKYPNRRNLQKEIENDALHKS